MLDINNWVVPVDIHSWVVPNSKNRIGTINERLGLSYVNKNRQTKEELLPIDQLFN